MSDLFDRAQERLDRFAAPEGAAEEAAALRRNYWREVNARQDERSALRQGNIDKFKVRLSDEEYAILNNAIATAEIPEDEAYRMASAIELAKQYNISVSQARANLDGYVEALFGSDEKYHIPKTAFNAIWGAGRNGVNTVRSSKLGNELNSAEEAGDEERSAFILRELDLIEKENEELADYQPRNFFVEALKFGAQSAPFTGYVAGAGIIGGLVHPIAGSATAFAASMDLARGSEYLELRKAGANHEIARNISFVTGVVQAAIETSLGNVASLAGGVLKTAGKQALNNSPIQWLTSKVTADVFKKLHYGGAFRRAAARIGRAGAAYLGEALEEGLEETLQELTSIAATQVAASLQGEGVETPTAREAAQRAAEAFRGGAMGSLVLGIPGVALNSRASVKSALNVKAMAAATDSREEFVRETANEEIFKGMPAEERKAAQEAIYARTEKAREKEIARELAEVKETLDLGEGGAERESAPDEEGNRAVNKEFRTQAGSLYIDHQRDEKPNGEVAGMFKAGNALEETSHNRYGHIAYRQIGDKVAISDFQMVPGWEYLRDEMYRDFAQFFSGSEISWDPKTDAGMAVKESLESKNPRGENAGLSYYADPAMAEEDRVRSEIVSRTLERTTKASAEELSAVLDIFESMIKPKGLTLADAWENWFRGEKITGAANKEVEAAQQAGTVVKGAANFARVAGQAKALIYVSKNADASTILHEFTHVAEANFTPEERRIAARALNGIMLQKQGRLAPVAFDENAASWTEDQREAFADNFETYMATGKAPEAIKPLFEKIKEFMRRIYRTLRDAIPLSREAKRLYESLITGDLARQAAALAAESRPDQAAETAGLASQAEALADAEAALPSDSLDRQLAAAATPGTEPDVFERQDLADAENTLEEFLGPGSQAEPLTEAERAPDQLLNSNPPTNAATTPAPEVLEIGRKDQALEILDSPDATLDEKIEAAFDYSGDIFQAEQTAAANESPFILFQIIGEQGAASLDQAEESSVRLDNLSVARRMETAGKDAKTVRLATGWERGADGKWRHEIGDDFRFDLSLLNLAGSFSGRLEEILSHDELFAAYPRLRETEVVINSQEALRQLFGVPYAGAYNNEKNELHINYRTLESAGPESLDSIFIHEIQHAIQDLEGFSYGSNTVHFDNLFSDTEETTEFLELEKEYRQYRGKKKLAEWLAVPENFKRIRSPFIKDIVNQFKSGALDKFEAGDKLWKLHQQHYENIAKKRETYERAAGEVEARNVQSRMGFTPRQRLETLLEETEDVSREDQAFLAKGVQTALAAQGGERSAAQEGSESPGAVTLFQTEEELAQDALTFSSWQEFYEIYEESPFRPENAAVPENATAQWYQTFWEKVKGIYPEESAVNDDLESLKKQDDSSPGDPGAMDALWMAEKMNKAGMQKFLEKIHSIVRTDLARWQPLNEQDAAERDRTAALQDRINRELRHVSWLANAAKVSGGEALSDRQYRTLRTLVRSAARDYRSLYAEIMEEPEWAVALADTTAEQLSTRVADPDKAAVDLMTPEERRRLAEELDIAEVSQRLEDGTLTMEDLEKNVQKAWKKVKNESRELAQKLKDLKEEIAEDYRNISDYQTRQLLRMAEEMYDARLKWRNRSDRTARMIQRGLKLTEKYERESRAVRSNYDTIFRKFSDMKQAAELTGAVREALARREAQYTERTRNNMLNRRARALAEIKRMRTQLVKRFNRRVKFENIDYKNALLIVAIQRMMHPSLVRGVNRWLGTEGPLLRAVYSQYTTDSDFRAKLLKSLTIKKGARLDELFAKPYDRLTRAERQELHKMLPKQDWVMDLELEERERERRDAIQLDLRENRNEQGEVVSITLGEELDRMLREALPEDLLARIQNRPFADWTLEEMEQLGKAVDDLYTEGRRIFREKEEARKLKNERHRDAISKAVTDSGIVINPDDPPEVVQKKLKDIDKKIGKFDSGVSGTRQNSRARQARFRRILAGYGDMNIRRAARMLDNGRDGVNTTLLYWMENTAFNQEQRAMKRRRDQVAGAMKELKITLGDLTKKIVLKDFLGAGQDQEFTADELLYVLLSKKEDQTRDAVRYGNFLLEAEKRTAQKEGFSDEDLLALANKGNARYNRVIAEAEKYFAEKGNEKLLKFAEAIERDYADNVERLSRFTIEEFNRPMWRADYYLPMNRLESTGEANPNRVLEDLAGISAAANKNYVGLGMTKKRIDIGEQWQTPIMLGLYSTWADSVERTEHLMAYGGMVKTLNAVYKDRKSGAIRQEIQRRYGDGMASYINEYINELANPWASGQLTHLDRIFKELRGKAAIANLAYRTSSILKQLVTSPAGFLQYVSPVEYAAAAIDFARHPLQLTEAIKEKSMHMYTRVFDPMRTVVREQYEKTEHPVGHAVGQANEMGMQGLDLVDWATVAPGWLATYRRELARLQKENQADYERRLAEYRKAEYSETLPTEEARVAKAESEILGEDEIEELAIAKADDVTRLTQPSGRSVDLAPMFKSKGPNSELVRIFLQFQVSLNVIWQNIRYDMPNAVRQKQWRVLVGGVAGYMVAGIAVNMLPELLAGDDDKKKEKDVPWWKLLTLFSTTQFTDSIPLIGSQVTASLRKAVTGRGTYLPNNLFPVEKELFDTGHSVIDALQKQSERKRKAAKAAWGRAAKNFFELMGYVAGFPVSGIYEAGRFLGIGDGDGELGVNPAALLGKK
jgi:hypothetical protein